MTTTTMPPSMLLSPAEQGDGTPATPSLFDAVERRQRRLIRVNLLALVGALATLTAIVAALATA